MSAFPSLSLVDLYAAFLQRSDDQSLVILQVDLSIAVEVGHGHPTVNVLLGRVIGHS